MDLLTASQEADFFFNAFFYRLLQNSLSDAILYTFELTGGNFRKRENPKRLPLPV